MWILALLVATAQEVKHPNLLLNKQEIEEVKVKVKDHPWAAKLLERVKAKSDQTLEAAIAWALTGEEKYAKTVRHRLVYDARYNLSKYETLDIKAEPEWGRWSHHGATAWAYDLAFDALAAEERELVERWLRTAARTMIAQENIHTTTPNLVFCQHWRIGMIGYALGDKELIEYALRDPGKHGPSRGGFYPVMDTMFRDQHFWAEAPIYALHYDVHGMYALAEAALRYDGTNLYEYTSPKSGASLKKIVDGYLRMGFPVEKNGAIRLATFGDGSTGCSISGKLEDTFMDGSFMAVLELAYKRFKDEGYAWILGLDPERAAYITRGRPAFSYVALTHGEVLPKQPAPPPAPSGLYPSMGFAMLRSDESPRYWTNGGLSAVVRLANKVGHGHEDYFSLILHGRGKLLYPDLNVIQYEPRWMNWTAEGIGHSTLLIDHESPAAGKHATRHDFAPEVKFFAIEGAAFDRSTQERAVLMTESYMVDLFRARDTEGRERTFDWVLHGLGRLFPGEPRAFRPTHDLVPFYGWIDREKSRATDGAWQADFIQLDQTGVRVTVLGAPGSKVYVGEGPLVDGVPHHRIDGHPEPSLPLTLVRRRAVSTTFAAVHEPYTEKPAIKSISLIEETPTAIGVRVDQDRLMVGTGTLRSDGEAFKFSGYGFVRLGDQVVARGKFEGLRVRGASLILNGEKVAVATKDGFILYGDVPEGTGTQPVFQPTPSLHGYFLPESLNLKAGVEREASLHLRAIGDVRETVRFSAPGLEVEPSSVEVTGSTTVKLRVRGAADGSYEVRALGEVLPVAVGVVLKKDRKLPRLAQWVARAPGYTMKVDEFSGVGMYLLDADGNRRFGRFGSGNFIHGFGAIQKGDAWIFRAQQASHQVWSGKDTLTILGEGRLAWTFKEDRIAVRYNLPTKPDLEHTMWLGNFDAIQAPLHNGTQRVPHEPVVADWLFFPHPVHRQGVMIRFSKKTAVSLMGGTAVRFPIKHGEEVSFGFATRDELGGEVTLPPGRFVLRSPIHLKSGMTLRGNNTTLVPCDGKQMRLAADAKAGAREIRLAEPLEVGDGIVIRDAKSSGFAITTTTIVGREGDLYRLADPLVRDYTSATATLAFPVISGRFVKDVTVEGITIEGNRENAVANMDGCRGAGIYLYESERVTIRNCTVRDYRGDGISVQWKSKDVLVENCRVENNAVFGLHPGSDSTLSTFRRNKSIGNGGPGLFVCVAVRHCRFESNEIRGNGGEGISIGERDSDNTFVANEIVGNKRAGILFRGDKEGDALEPHRNVFERNKLEGNGAEIVIRGNPKGLIWR